MNEDADDDLSVGLQLIEGLAEIEDPVAQREAIIDVWKCEARLADQQRYSDALRLVDGLLAFQLGRDPSELVEREIAYTMLGRAERLQDLERFGEAAIQADELARRYAADLESVPPGLRKYLARALYETGWSLYKLERWPEALVAFEDLIAEADSVPASARWMVAAAFSDRGNTLWMMGKRSDASEAYAEAISAFADDDDPYIAGRAEESTLNLALVLAKLERLDEASAIADGLIARLNPIEPLHVATAYRLKAELLFTRREYDVAVSTIDAFADRFGASDDPAVRLEVAHCMSLKVGILKRLGPAEAASYAAEQFVNRFGADLDPQIERIVARHAHRLGRGRSRLRFPGLG